MWKDFSSFIVNMLFSIISVITAIFYLNLFFKSKDYSKKENKVMLLKLFFILISSTSFCIFVFIVLYRYNLLDNVLNYIK